MLKPDPDAADRSAVSEPYSLRSAPARYDVVEVIDLKSGSRVTAAVADTCDGRWSLVFDLAPAIPQAASVHWDDGDAGWQAKARLEHVEDTTAHFQIASPPEWEPAPVLRSLRTPVDNAPMLVRITESGTLPKDRRVHTICIDISDSGCRASWPGSPPAVGDTVEVAWEADSRNYLEPEWIPARIARITPRPFAGVHVGFTFDATNPAHAARVVAWHRTWLAEHRRSIRTRGRAAADSEP
jgi:hypothetical protein